MEEYQTTHEHSPWPCLDPWWTYVDSEYAPVGNDCFSHGVEGMIIGGTLSLPQHAQTEPFAAKRIEIPDTTQWDKLLGQASRSFACMGGERPYRAGVHLVDLGSGLCTYLGTEHAGLLEQQLYTSRDRCLCVK
jgi:hypothetical protein